MDLLSIIKNAFYQTGGHRGPVYNLTGSSAALFLALQENPFWAVEKDDSGAEALARDIHFYRQLLCREEPVHHLPEPDGPAVSGLRALLLDTLGNSASVATSSVNLSSPVWDRESLSRHRILLKKGLGTGRAAFEEALIRSGYRSVSLVADRGEYSRRGWLIDIFPSNAPHPVRIEFFGDEIEQMRSFDIETQRSLEETPETVILPAREPEKETSLIETLKDRTCFCLYPPQEDESYPESAVILSRFSFPVVGPGEEPAALPGQLKAPVLSFIGLGILPAEREGLDDLPDAVRRLSQENRVVIVASSEGQAARLKDLFSDGNVIAPLVSALELPGYEGMISITVGRLSAGLFCRGVAILTERELFGQRAVHRPLIKSKVSRLLFTLEDILPGDHVVHREHGIGRFEKVIRQKIEGHEWELMLIAYEDGRLYIPVQDIQSLSKYHVEEGITPKTDRLGGRTWLKKKEKVRKKVHEMAEKLLALYADRKVSRGFVFSPDSEMHREFDRFFAYEETPDQIKAIEDIKRDMESEMPADRLLCGDVGYGKTEVAMRAAFKAVYDNRQAAVLVPTTILAEQHYRTFKERFSGFPLTIDFLSRFKSPKEMSRTKKGIAGGGIDIIIGTHSLLSKKISFSRLGLLIVDEEHRFGVSQKERIKEMSRNIDVLTLTATPIPRTLHMALSGIRDISVIETPPEERLAVKTIVTAFNEKLIRDVMHRELQRNGQVFFVHNRIQDIHKTALRISRLVPSAEVAVAHGQMDEKELESIMHRFFEGRVGILVSTAIIGSGLDIPRANTIIINRADRMGLADLYQLRGRVGRSNLKGYAYFLIPGETMMTDEARKRIQAVQEMSYLGAGFRLALKDLEIRGAGNIFGPEQSGHIHDIGFDLYMEMLEKAVSELKGMPVKEEIEPEITLSSAAFIPDAYIGDITLRLSCYRRIASLKTDAEAADLLAELKDRFGDLPEEVLNLLDVMRLKIAARKLSAIKIQQSGEKIRTRFSSGTIVQPVQIFGLAEKRKGRVRFFEDGFELDVGGMPPKKAFSEIHGTLLELQEAVSEQAGP